MKISKILMIANLINLLFLLTRAAEMDERQHSIYHYKILAEQTLAKTEEIKIKNDIPLSEINLKFLDKVKSVGANLSPADNNIINGLIIQNADINIFDEDGDPALIIAVKNGNTSLTELLISHR